MKYRSGEYDKRRAKETERLKAPIAQTASVRNKKVSIQEKGLHGMVSKKDLFFSVLIDVRERDGHCYCASREQIKPMWLDDLLWDLLDMPENKKEPVSLRGIGAFTVYGSELYEAEEELVRREPEELEKYVVQYLEHFRQTIQLCEIEKFYACMDRSPYHQELRKGLSLIYNGEYQAAIEYLAPRGKGSLCNGEIWCNTAMIDYSKNKLSHRKESPRREEL